MDSRNFNDEATVGNSRIFKNVLINVNIYNQPLGLNSFKKGKLSGLDA